MALRRPIEFGLGALSAQTVDGTAQQTGDALDLLLRACVRAESAGLDSVWLSEHHFSEDGYLPSPFTTLAAVARETDTVRLSTNVACGPLYDPVRLAEDCAVIDQLSGGRLMVGLGLGYRQIEFDGLGRSRRDRAASIEQMVPFLRRAWKGDSVHTPSGAPVRLRPLPRQGGGPPILLGAFVEKGVRRAARLADGWIAPELAHPRQLAKRLSFLDLDAVTTSPFHVVVTMNVVVASRDAWLRVRPGVRLVSERYRRWLQESGDIPSLKGKSFDEDADKWGRPPQFVAGTVNECIQQLMPWCELLHALPDHVVPHVTARMVFPGVPDEVALESIDLWGREVIPALQERAAATPATP